ncbi:unnamed protein product [Adineta ricciae]|uniref:Uncharacterized protein n=1 Tax=Adineta ricciae TaxID=249248 RepID=A0A814SKR3_ADIRI|nr:unnamed protein product [Adineta ricciae]CAF1555749.1 unnamed protein product [Adineta ricciae]
MNFHTSYDDKDTIIHRLQTHISILEQQQNSNGYFSYEETPSLNDQFSTHNESQESAVALEKLLQKREYELEQLREQFNEHQQEADDKLQRTVAQFNNLEQKLTIVESDRDDLRRRLQILQDENDLLKSYMNRLPSEIEYEKLQQSHRILQDQLEQSNQTVTEYRKEKNQLKKQLVTYQRRIDEQQQQFSIKSQESMSDQSIFNAKCLTIDERIETQKKFEELNKIIQQLNEQLNKEKSNRKHDQHLNETNVHTVESLSIDLAKKEQTIKEMTNLLRQNRQELSDFRVRLLVNEQDQKQLNERLLNNAQFSKALHRIQETMDKLFLVLDFSSEMLNNDSTSSPDVLMLQLSNHKPKSDSTDPSVETVQKIDLYELDKLESKLDQIVDRLLSIRSELIARQFENDLRNATPCRLQ